MAQADASHAGPANQTLTSGASNVSGRERLRPTAAEAARLYRVFADSCLGYCALDAGLAALEPSIRNADLLSWEIQYRTLPASDSPASPPSRTRCPPSMTRKTSPPPSTS
jgi:hypothetical protein